MTLQTIQEYLFGASGDTFRFAHPWMLLGLLLLPLLLALMAYRERHRTATIKFSGVGFIRRAGVRQSRFWRRFLNALRAIALGLLIIAVARPQFGRVERQTWSEGIDIELLLDVSLSMRATDFYPNRLEAAKEVIKDFIGGRTGDRLGLIIFASEPAALVPLTLDYGVLKSFVDRVQFNLVNGNSTAIGTGLATAVAKLRTSKAKSKVVILLTDGENNAGKIAPLAAAEAAKASHIRVYTIGVGSENPQVTMMGMQPEAGIDEKSLQQIADLTGGMYFRATDEQKLGQIYAQIAKMEKTRAETTQFDSFRDLAPWLIGAALLLLLLEHILRNTRFLKIP